VRSNGLVFSTFSKEQHRNSTKWHIKGTYIVIFVTFVHVLTVVMQRPSRFDVHRSTNTDKQTDKPNDYYNFLAHARLGLVCITKYKHYIILAEGS